MTDAVETFSARWQPVARSPDAAERNPGAYVAPPYSASLHPGYLSNA